MDAAITNRRNHMFIIQKSEQIEANKYIHDELKAKSYLYASIQVRIAECSDVKGRTLPF